jgi:hypothetical protein
VEADKAKHGLQIPVDPENTPELMAVIEAQQARGQPACPFIFHGKRCGTGIGMARRIPHDLRRSGVKHYIDAGVEPHTR